MGFTEDISVRRSFKEEVLIGGRKEALKSLYICGNSYWGRHSQEALIGVLRLPITALIHIYTETSARKTMVKGIVT